VPEPPSEACRCMQAASEASGAGVGGRLGRDRPVTGRTDGGSEPSVDPPMQHTDPRSTPPRLQVAPDRPASICWWRPAARSSGRDTTQADRDRPQRQASGPPARNLLPLRQAQPRYGGAGRTPPQRVSRSRIVEGVPSASPWPGPSPERHRCHTSSTSSTDNAVHTTNTTPLRPCDTRIHEASR